MVLKGKGWIREVGVVRFGHIVSKGKQIKKRVSVV